jgi:hypothetical protein
MFQLALSIHHMHLSIQVLCNSGSPEVAAHKPKPETLMLQDYSQNTESSQNYSNLMPHASP